MEGARIPESSAIPSAPRTPFRLCFPLLIEPRARIFRTEFNSPLPMPSLVRMGPCRSVGYRCRSSSHGAALQHLRLPISKCDELPGNHARVPRPPWNTCGSRTGPGFRMIVRNEAHWWPDADSTAAGSLPPSAQRGPRVHEHPRPSLRTQYVVAAASGLETPSNAHTASDRGSMLLWSRVHGGSRNKHLRDPDSSGPIAPVR